jgi:GTPase
VPPGTLVKDRERGNVLKDLVEPGDELIIPGGRGGRGNKHFASATNRSPREFEPGEEGEERWITLELKVIADAGLVGFPNAGKSTLLSRLSRATPEIASYPFTTKQPNLGIVSLGHDAVFVMADLPGLIEGASQGVGLGHEFLRHVDRTRVLIHLVEPFPTDGTDAVKNYHTIRSELQTYSAELAQKPELICVSKAELTDAAAVRDALAAELGREVLLISSVTGEGLQKLVGKAVEMITEQRRIDREAKERAKPVEFATEKAIRETE